MKSPLFSVDREYFEDSAADLRGRQSVRTTFKLSERSIHALRILACQLGIKQKSLFDHLVDDVQALQVIAGGAGAVETKGRRVAKTYVISRKALENIEQICARFQTPRDVLVEYSIERILPLVFQEKEKHDKRKALMEDLRRYLLAGSELLEQAEASLGADDPVFEKILIMMKYVRNCSSEVEMFVKKGEQMESF